MIEKKPGLNKFMDPKLQGKTTKCLRENNRKLAASKPHRAELDELSFHAKSGSHSDIILENHSFARSNASTTG